MFTHSIRVRYGEVDQMGFAHHSVYALYLEEARTEVLRKHGVSYRAMEDRGMIMPVRSMEFKFMAAAKYDDLIHVGIRWEFIKGTRVLFYYTIHNEKGILLCEAKTELFFANKETLRPIRIPQEILDIPT